MYTCSYREAPRPDAVVSVNRPITAITVKGCETVVLHLKNHVDCQGYFEGIEGGGQHRHRLRVYQLPSCSPEFSTTERTSRNRTRKQSGAMQLL